MNSIQKLKKTHPRLWAVITFPAFVFATFILFPIEMIVVFVPCLWSEIKSAFSNIIWDWKDCKKEPLLIIKLAWKDWVCIIRTGKGLEDEAGHN